MPFQIFETESRSILSPTNGFIREAGFTHSLTPARNCTFGCSYCYVPTMGIYGGLKPEDWRHWGQFTTFKKNAAELLRRSLRSDQRIYCSPVVDPYQPAESSAELMPAILDVVEEHPPLVFVIQTRGPLIVRDLTRLVRLAKKTRVRVSFSVTTNREEIRRIYEPNCAPMEDRLQTLKCLRDAGIECTAALAPILPCDPEELARLVLEVTAGDVIADPLHTRASKKHGATTREAAIKISGHREFSEWLEPAYQAEILARIGCVVRLAGRRFARERRDLHG